MSRYTELAKTAACKGDFENALIFIALGTKAEDAASILVAHYLMEETKIKGDKQAYKTVLIPLLEKYGDFDIKTAFMLDDEFEKKKNVLSEMLYIRYVYMCINEGKNILNSSNYMKMQDSVYGFVRYYKIIDIEEDKKEFKEVINNNNAFLGSIKKSLFGNISYNKQLLSKVVDGLTKSYNKFFERMSEEQIKELNESAGINYRIGEVLGGGFFFAV